MASESFLRILRQKTKDLLPREVFEELMRVARASSGGHAKAQKRRHLDDKKKKQSLLKQSIEKGFINGDPEGGVHAHSILRNLEKTQEDGAHLHIFTILDKDGIPQMVFTDEDGEHGHTLSEPSSNVLAASISAHRHKLIIFEEIELKDGTIIEAGTELRTEKDGQHSHGADMLETSNFDGTHKHDLLLPDGSRIISLDIQEFWNMFGPFDLSNVPPLPPASTITRGLLSSLDKAPYEEEDEEKRKRITKQELRPFKRFTPPNPAIRATGNLDDQEDQHIEDLSLWASSRMPLSVEPIFPGERATIEYSNNRSRLTTRANRSKNLLPDLARLKDQVESVPSPFIADGYLSPDGKVFWAFDLPFWGESLANDSLKDRRQSLESFISENFQGSEEFQIVPQEIVSSIDELKPALRKFMDENFSGVISRPFNSTYELSASTTLWNRLDFQINKEISLDQAMALAAMGVGIIKDAEGPGIPQDLEMAFAALGWGIDPIEKANHRQEIDEILSKQEEGTQIQTLIFDKKKFPTADSAKRWAKDNDFSFSKVDENEDSFRLRQRDPADFSRIRTITLRDGIKATVGPLKKEKNKKNLEGDLEISKELLAAIPESLKILKQDKRKGIVYSVVLEADTFDLQDDRSDIETIEDAAHFFLRNSRTIGYRHKKKALGAEVVESMVLKPGDVFQGIKFSKAVWIIGIKLTKQLLQAVDDGEINAVSIGGFGLRTPLN